MSPPRDALLSEPFEPEAIAREVAAHRGVTPSGAVRFGAWDDGAALHLSAPGNNRSAATRSYWNDFGLGQPDASVVADLPTLFKRGIAGFYDTRAKLVRIEERANRSEQARAWVLVHEIEHALQDQSSRLSAKAQNDDEALAVRAVIEGDAEITAAAFVASRKLAFDHWLAQLLAHERDPARAAELFADTHAPDFVRRQWRFPYVEGTVFVGALYGAGGYPLVNRMFEHPPVSTEQVIHVEKYLAGELPVSVPVPVTPEGYSVVTTGTMGELRTRGLVAPCEGEADSGTAEDTASGWGGDTFEIVTGEGERHAILWNTVWDDEDSARRFSTHLRARDACIRGRLGPDLASQSAAVGSDGARVAYVRGLPADPSAAAVRALLAAPLDRPVADPPLGDVRLRPTVDPRSFLGKGALRGGRYVSEPLGLSLSVEGFDVLDSYVTDELILEEYFGISDVRLQVTALLTSWTRELEQRMAWNSVGAVEEAGIAAAYLGETSVATSVGRGRALRWSIQHVGQAFLLAVPVCGEKITITIRGHRRRLGHLGRGAACRASPAL
jgi:hypothetical protein